MQRQSKQTADDVILHFYMTDSLLITTAEMLREVKHAALNGNFIVTKKKIVLIKTITKPVFQDTTYF